MSGETKSSTPSLSTHWPLRVLLEVDILSTFFELLDISKDKVASYVAECTKNNIKNVHELRERASLQSLQETVGLSREHATLSMRKLFEVDLETPVSYQNMPRRRDLLPPRANGSTLLTRNNLVILNEIGHGASGRVYRALFVPTLKLIVVKYIEIKGPLEQQVVCQELKTLYAICYTPIEEPDKPMTLTSSTHPSSPISPYIIKFYGAFVDVDYGAVCLTLEFMNGGSLQDLFDEGKILNLDEACILSYFALQALSTLHKKNIVHRDVKPSNFLVNTQGAIQLSDFGITKELMVARQADSFLGTVSYMNCDRVRGCKYSFEADFWGLGITLIVVVAGVHPFDINNGMWILMKNILESPQPELDESFNHDLRDFVRACLNATPNDSSVAEQLLEHPLLTAAKARGVIADDCIAKLPNPPTEFLRAHDTEAGEINQIVQVSLSWQLEHYGEDQRDVPNDGTSTMMRFPPERIKALAHQMNVNPVLLEEKYRAKYAQIDRLCQHSWSLEGLRREMWGNPDEGKIANHVMLFAPHPRFTVDVEHSEPLVSFKPIATVELPADIGQYAVHTHTSTPSSPSHAIKTEEHTEDRDTASSCISKERGNGTTVLPVVAAAKDIGKNDEGKSTVSGEHTM